MDEQWGAYHLLSTIFFYLHTLSLSLCKEGIHWSINSTRIMGMGLEHFLVFFNYFVLFSLARIGFPKKPDEKQRISKVHP